MSGQHKRFLMCRLGLHAWYVRRVASGMFGGPRFVERGCYNCERIQRYGL